MSIVQSDSSAMRSGPAPLDSNTTGAEKVLPPSVERTNLRPPVQVQRPGVQGPDELASAKATSMLPDESTMIWGKLPVPSFEIFPGVVTLILLAARRGDLAGTTPSSTQANVA